MRCTNLIQIPEYTPERLRDKKTLKIITSK
jgi:hypothetical protein